MPRKIKNMRLNEQLKKTLHLFGLEEWKVLWDPDPTQPIRGECFPEPQLIMIYDQKPEDVQETLLHEILEIKLRPLLGVYRGTINSLIELLDKIAYQHKEALIEDLTPIILQSVREGTPEMTYPEQREYCTETTTKREVK